MVSPRMEAPMANIEPGAKDTTPNPTTGFSGEFDVVVEVSSHPGELTLFKRRLIFKDGLLIEARKPMAIQTRG
jgi:hypothetical protein